MSEFGYKEDDSQKVAKEADVLSEHRMFSRFRVNFPARFRNLNLGKRGEGRCIDIGAGGVGIETDQSLDVKVPVEINIDVSDGFDPITLKGRVVWAAKSDAENCKAGIVFDCPRLIAFSRVLKMLRR